MCEYEVTRITLKQSDLEEELLPQLLERVFHVTTQEAWPFIEASGRVLGSPPDCFVQWPNAGLRCLGYVSLCDLRSLDEEELQHGLEKYPHLLYPLGDSSGPVYLFLRRSAIHDIGTYQQLADRVNDLGKLIVPHIEAGYAGDLSLAKIADVLVVDVLRSPTPLLGRLQAEQRRPVARAASNHERPPPGPP